MYHSWGVRPIMTGNVIKGVVFESKEGRKAVMVKAVSSLLLPHFKSP